MQREEMGVCTIEDIFIDGALTSFSQLQQKFKFPQSFILFYRFLQIRNYIYAHILLLDNASPSIIHKCLDQCEGSKKALSSFLKEEWEKELGVEIFEEMWQFKGY